MERQLKRRTAALRKQAIPVDGQETEDSEEEEMQETEVSEDEDGQETEASEEEDAENADPAGLHVPQHPARPPAPEPLHGV